jgi:hypothetical protein
MPNPVIELMEAQAEFLLADNPRYIGLLGGYRSGKTRVACLKAVRLASLNIGYDGMMLEPTGSLLSSVLIPTFIDVLGQLEWATDDTTNGPWYEINQHRALLHFKDGDVMIHFRSSENWERIVGFSLAWFIADEFDTSGIELCRKAWMRMVARLTKGNVMQGCITSTKEGYQWAYNFFVKDANEDREMINIYVKDNKFIDEGYVEMMRSQLTPKQFEAYVNNEFVNQNEGSVYDCFDRNLNRSQETLAKHPNAPLNIGIDFNKSKMATCVGIILGKQVHMIDELYGSANTAALIKALQARYPNRQLSFFVDYSGTYHASSAYTEASLTDVQQLQAAFGQDSVRTYRGHLPIIGKPGQVNRVGIVNQQFCNAAGYRNLFINDTTCPRLASCIEQQGFVNGMPDKGNDVDHMPDALGYFIAFIFLPIANRAKVSWQ